ncbi:MAG: YicC family protein [Desulfobacterales bacterium]|nr:YicC family protein [Desulfobacterales bacterium]MBF0396155.1 YicC family protein [Desulfobacterales bacterium]
MIKSMTGFTRVEKTEDNLMVIIEIRAYNSRHLDVIVRLPSLYSSLEEKIKIEIGQKITRGRVEVMLQIKKGGENEISDFEIDLPKAQSYYNAVLVLKNRLNLPGEISIDVFGNLGNFIKPIETVKDIDTHWIFIKNTLCDALSNLDNMRKEEGCTIAKDFLKRLDYINDCIEKIDSESKNLVKDYQDRLKERIIALTSGMVELDANRIVQEAAFIADRSDISEEILRAKSHLSQFINFINSDEICGRKLNFLLQEFNREFNTIGAKVGSVKASHIVVDVKSELEKLREQVQNVE